MTNSAQTQYVSRSRWYAVLVTLIVGLGIGLADAKAQFARLDGNPFEPTVRETEIDEIAAMFELDETHVDLIKSLYGGYRTAFDTGADGARESLHEIRIDARETRDWEEMSRQMKKAGDVWHERRAELERQFFNDVKSVLNEQQVEQWSSYERDWRRRNLLRRGARLSGESVDLINVVKELELEDEERASLDESLLLYARDIDAALQERQRATEELAALQTDLTNEESMTRMREMYERLGVRRQSVRDVNMRYVDILQNQLSEESSDALMVAFHTAAYPGIFRPTPADQYIAMARDIESLTEEQTETIENIASQYETEVYRLNLKMAEFVEDSIDRNPQIAAATHELEHKNGGGSPRPSSLGVLEERRTVWEDKDRLVRTTIDNIYMALNPEQQAELQRPNLKRRDRGELDEETRRIREERGNSRPLGPGGGTAGGGG